MTIGVDFLTVHFGDTRWTLRLVESICSLESDHELSCRNVYVIDNSREGEIFRILRGRFSSHTFKLIELQYPVDHSSVALYAHDHHVSLERGLRESDADLLVVLDCDAHLMTVSFLAYLRRKMLIEKADAIVASDPRFESLGLSHPCFMALNKRARQVPLPFDPAIEGNHGQTGRLTARVLAGMGLRVHTPRRIRAFGGVLGDVYDTEVYHHGSGTFASSEDVRLTRQVHWWANTYSKAVLEHRRLSLTRYEKVKVACLARLEALSSLWQ